MGVPQDRLGIRPLDSEGAAADRLEDAQEFSALLTELKERSGLSYTELGRRTFTTSSTLHRYCTGASVPRDYNVVATIAKGCGATSDELTNLLRCWTAAVRQQSERPSVSARLVEASRCKEPTSPTISLSPLRSEPAPHNPAGQQAPVVRSQKKAYGIRTHVLGVMLLTLALVGISTSLIAFNRQGEVIQVPVPSALAGNAGARWIHTPGTVSPRMFGVTLNSDTGTMPSFQVGSVRFWDSYTLWADLEPERDKFQWETLDRLVQGAQHAGKPAVFTLGGTPAWAAPNGRKSLYPNQARTSPPDNLADWDVFVRELVARYRGRLEAYELWDTANDSHFYSGSIETLVEVTRRAAHIIRGEDPNATIVCPSMGHLSESAGLLFMQRFAELGGYDSCDVAGLKMSWRPAEQPPEAMAVELATVHLTLHKAGVAPRLWDTGPDYDVVDQPQVTGDRARNYAMRFYLMGLYGRDLDLERAYFYDWGGVRIPIVLQVEKNDPTPAAHAVEQLQRWLTDTSIRGCGHGQAADLPHNVWQCEFIGNDARHQEKIIRWAIASTADTTVGAQGAAVYRLDGTITAVAPNGRTQITQEPVLIVRTTSR